MSTRALPSVAAYGRALPDGWGSYPACRARASLLESLMRAGALDGLEALPSELSTDLASPADGWIAEVTHVGVMLAVRDRRFAGKSGEDAFLAWLHRLNADLLPDRSDIGPAAAMLEFPRMWSDFHRGTTLDVLDAGPNHALLGSTHPDPLFPEIAKRWRRDAIGGYLVRAGAVQPRVRELGRVDARTHVAITWT